MNQPIRLFCALAMLIAYPGHAHAHARLVQAAPEAGSTIAAPPTDISLRFNERIDARFSSIDLTGPDGAKIATGEIAVQDQGMVAPVPVSLAPGVYQVDWKVLSADGHKLKGSFKFEVRP